VKVKEFVKLLVAANTVRAMLVYILLVLMCVIIISNRDVPEIVSSAVMLIVGSFFDYPSNGSTDVANTVKTQQIDV
jgi:multisubunit Na+/H+ antiporter MnhE subunit